MSEQDKRFRRIFRTAHADHARCADDEWLHEACESEPGVPHERPVVWSRRNGPWRRVRVLWVGAAPGNAGGLGSSDLGAHGTRIPFGGDIAGANLDVLLGSIGLTRNDTFIVASLNQLPEKGGGEPTTRELSAPVGDYPDSIALLRDTVVATGPDLIIALGNVALRSLTAALIRSDDRKLGEAGTVGVLRLPGMKKLADAGFERGTPSPWPDEVLPLADGFVREWQAAWHTPPAFDVLPLLHPSAQNMSPFARASTVFHTRMLETRDALQAAAAHHGLAPVHPRPLPPDDGIYALREWRERIAARHDQLDELWRAHGV